MKNIANSYFETFIGNLSDHEIVIYQEYSSIRLMPNNREKLILEISKRKIPKDQSKIYLSKRLDHKNPKEINCVHCGSWKFNQETDFEHLAGKYSTITVANDSKRCMICNYNPEKETPRNIFDRMKKYVKRRIKQRVIKVESWYS